MSIKVFNIQRFSLHDGPGIRTTIFLKGCSLKCPWCCNPESNSLTNEVFFDKAKCVKRGNSCFIHNDCPYIKNKVDRSFFKKNVCPAVRHVFTDYSTDKLFKEIVKDKKFFSKSGGVTFSGGEALLQYAELLPLLKHISKEKIHVTMETSLSTPIKNLKSIYKFVNLFYVDFKTGNRLKAHNVLSLDLELYKKNLIFLFEHFDNKKIVIRIPIVDKFNNSKEDLLEAVNFLSDFNIKQMEIFSVHNLASSKYEMLGRKFVSHKPVSSSSLLEAQNILSKVCENIKIITI